MNLRDERQHHQAVREVLATVCVEWYFDRVRLWWSAWLLMWRSIGMEAGR